MSDIKKGGQLKAHE
jgi:hypothetical protein